MDDLLTQAMSSYRAGNKAEARKIISAYIKEYPQNEQGWICAYNTSNTDRERAYCLRQMLKINPDNSKARQLLSQLPAPQPAKKKQGIKAPLFLGAAALCLFAICGVGLLFINNEFIKTSSPASTIHTSVPVEKVIELTASAADAQTAAAYTPPPLATNTFPPETSTEVIIPTSTIFIFELQTSVAATSPTAYVYYTNTPFTLGATDYSFNTNTPFVGLQSTPTLSSGGGGGGGSSGVCCKQCGPNSKPCGDSCISNSYQCNKAPGCAC